VVTERDCFVLLEDLAPVGEQPRDNEFERS
jgi:hypothetical protein